MPYPESKNHQSTSIDTLTNPAIKTNGIIKYNLAESEFRLKLSALFSGKYYEVVIQDSHLLIRKNKNSDSMEIDLNLKELVLTLKDILTFLQHGSYVADSNEHVSLCIDALKVLAHRLNPKNRHFSELIFSLNKVPSALEKFSLALAVLNSSDNSDVRSIVTKILKRLEALTFNNAFLKDNEIDTIQSILIKFNKSISAIKNFSLNNYSEAFAELKSDFPALNSRITHVESVTDQLGGLNHLNAIIIITETAEYWPDINENFLLIINSLTVLKKITDVLHVDYAEIMLTTALAKNIFNLFSEVKKIPAYNFINSFVEAILSNLIQSLIGYKQTYDENNINASRQFFYLTFILLEIIDENRIWQSSQHLADQITNFIKIAPEGCRFKNNIQSGGYGTVSLYQYKETSGKKIDLALKTLKKHGNKQQRDFLLNEIAALYILNHVNIIGFAGIQVNAGEPFGLFLEYAKNRSLFDLLLLAKPKLSIGRVLNIALAIARAVAYIHKRGFVHCDIKTENILLSDDSGNVDSVKVADLGFMKNPDTDGNSSRGTIVYLSPELARSWVPNTPEELKVGNTTASDVWAMAIVFSKLVRQSPIIPDSCISLEQKLLWLATIETQAHVTQFFKVYPSKDTPDVLRVITNNCFSVFADTRPNAECIQSRLEAEMRLR